MFYQRDISIKLTQEEYKTYAKQLILENIGINGQKRLKNAKILIVGLGGLGSPILLYLISAGICNIGLIDDDKVNISNLNRQILYTIYDINHNKTLSAKLRVTPINPKCKINIYNTQLNQKNAHSLIKLYDIIIDGTDNFKTRYIIDETCYQLHKIHIYGAINQYEGHVSVFNYKNNFRYIDLYPKTLNLKNVNCEDNGIIGVMSGLIGLLQATEAIKIILGVGNILSGYILKYNLLKTSFQKIQCNPIKNKYPKIIDQSLYNKSLNFVSFNKIDNRHNNNFIIIDIRNQLDFRQTHLYKTINIPANQFQISNTIKFLKTYLNKYTIVLSCNKIILSSSIAQLLNKYHIKTYILNKI